MNWVATAEELRAFGIEDEGLLTIELTQPEAHTHPEIVHSHTHVHTAPLGIGGADLVARHSHEHRHPTLYHSHPAHQEPAREQGHGARIHESHTHASEAWPP